VTPLLVVASLGNDIVRQLGFRETPGHDSALHAGAQFLFQYFLYLEPTLLLRPNPRWSVPDTARAYAARLYPEKTGNVFEEATIYDAVAVSLKGFVPFLRKYGIPLSSSLRQHSPSGRPERIAAVPEVVYHITGAVTDGLSAPFQIYMFPQTRPHKNELERLSEIISEKREAGAEAWAQFCEENKRSFEQQQDDGGVIIVGKDTGNPVSVAVGGCYLFAEYVDE
jgi:hypothetical protein